MCTALLAALLAVGCGTEKVGEQATPAKDGLEKPPELMRPAGADDHKGAAPAPAAADERGAPQTETDEPVRDQAPPDDAEPARRASAKRGRKRASTADKPEAREIADVAPVRVKRILFAERISSREPVDPEETFEAGETDKLYAFVELSNESKKKSKIVVRFIPPAGSPTKVTLDVGDKSRWRTWALRRGIQAVGTWTVTVSDESGTELGKRTFEVTE